MLPTDSNLPATSAAEPTPAPPAGASPGKKFKTGKARRFWSSVGSFLWRYKHLALPLIAAIVALSNTYILLGPVLNRSGDNIYHILNQYALAHGIRSGDNPLGPLSMEFGQPVLRFYQALFYLVNVAVSLAFRLHLMFLHNLAIVVCFAASPFAYYYFLRKLGINQWASAIGSMASLTSIAAFGNSFEAYHQAGIVTQSMGGVFFPWFMGNFIGMFRGENRASTTGLLFALAFLSHAIMSVFAVFAGALYFLVTRSSFTRNWKKLLAFCVFGAALVAFWVFPFLTHTNAMRPIPDSIIRGAGVHWFTSVSKDELDMVLTSGRLLDDARFSKKSSKTPEDRLMDKISIIHTLRTRPPVVSLLTALGCLVALLTLRRDGRRFLLAGFAFSLMLFAGPDDYPWLRFLPFMKQIQTFRCTYLIEFFAFGLIGIGVETTLRKFWRFATRRALFARLPLKATWSVIALVGFIWCANEIFVLGQTHLRVRNPDRLNKMVDAISTLPYRARPFRVKPQYSGRVKIFHAWLARFGYQPYCTHWKGTGPTAAFHMCMAIGSPITNGDLYALAGIRYFTGEHNEIGGLIRTNDEEGDPLFERLPNGRDRKKRRNDWHYLFDSGRDHFLRPFVGQPLPVVASHGQWIWLNKSWIGKYRQRLREEKTPLPLRVPKGELAQSGLLEHASALIYLDEIDLEQDLPALKKYVADGGQVITPSQIPGLDVISIGNHENSKSIWSGLPEEFHAEGNPSKEKPREDEDPAFEQIHIEHANYGNYSVQNFVFDVDVLKPTVAILPMQAAPGWNGNATLDGQPINTFASGGDMVGVYLPSGAHRLEFHWKMPPLDKLFLLISFLALAAVLGIWSRAGTRRFRAWRGLRRERLEQQRTEALVPDQLVEYSDDSKESSTAEL